MLIFILPLVPLIAAGTALAGNAFNAISTGVNNRRSRQFSLDMYNRQRQDALADWQLQNDYNSPANQMKRFKEAGLSPMLAYSQANQAPAVRSTSADSWNPQPARIDPNMIGNSLLEMYDIRLKEAQTNNVKAATTSTIQDAILKALQGNKIIADIKKLGVDTKRSELSLNMAESLQNVSMETTREQLRKLQLGNENMELQTTVLRDRNEREAAMNSQSIKESVARILTMRIQNAKSEEERKNLIQQRSLMYHDQELRILDTLLKKSDLNLKEIGIQPHDNIIFRMTDQYLKKLNDPENRRRIQEKLPIKNPVFDKIMRDFGIWNK